MFMILLVFFAAYFSVFLLGLNSKVLRDDHIILGSLISWGITVSQYAMTWAVIHADLLPEVYLLSAGFGGMIGITTSQYFYKWLNKNVIAGRKI